MNDRINRRSATRRSIARFPALMVFE